MSCIFISFILLDKSWPAWAEHILSRLVPLSVPIYILGEGEKKTGVGRDVIALHASSIDTRLILPSQSHCFSISNHLQTSGGLCREN